MFLDDLVHQYWFQEKKYLHIGKFLTSEEAENSMRSLLDKIEGAAGPVSER